MIVRRICPHCEQEGIEHGEIQPVLRYAWKDRKYGQWELFPPAFMEQEC